MLALHWRSHYRLLNFPSWYVKGMREYVEPMRQVVGRGYHIAGSRLFGVDALHKLPLDEGFELLA
jgi:hypothetical protein